MDKINSYGAYRNDYIRETKNRQSRENGNRTDRYEEKAAVYEPGGADRTAGKPEAQLSGRAKALLEELKKKYGNADFTVANYGSAKEAARYLAGGGKEFGVLIEPELLEEMAADGKARAKYEKIIEDSAAKLKGMAQNLGDGADTVKTLGIALDKDGGVSFFAELEKLSEKQRERIEKGRESAGQENAVCGNGKEKGRETLSGDGVRVYASTAEELFEKIRNYGRQTKDATAARQIDYTV